VTEPAREGQLPSRALFESWLEDMHPRVSRFVDFLLPPSVVGDFSRDSLAGLEKLLLERFPDPELFFRGERDLDFIDGAVRYVGETYLRAFGGGWRYSDDPESVVVGRPYVLLGTPDATPISPYNLMGAALHRRTGQVLIKVYDGQARAIEERRAGDPSFMVERESVPGMHVSTAEKDRRLDEGATFLDSWLAQMEETLARWREALAPGEAARLDGSVESLAACEETVLSRLPDTDSLASDSSASFVAGAVYYIGRVYRDGAGGDWRYIAGDPDPKLRLVGRPYLERQDDAGDDRRVVPELVLRSVVRKRVPGTLVASYQQYAS
jgi:hypothetical protein